MTNKTKNWEKEFDEKCVEKEQQMKIVLPKTIKSFVSTLLKQQRENLLQGKNIKKWLKDYKNDIERARKEERARMIKILEGLEISKYTKQEVEKSINYISLKVWNDFAQQFNSRLKEAKEKLKQ